MSCLRPTSRDSAASNRVKAAEATKNGKTSERALTKRIEAFLTSKGIYWSKNYGCGMGKAGKPDIFACVHGLFFAIEVKSSTGSLTKLQAKSLQEIEASHGRSFVVTPDNFESFKKTVEDIYDVQKEKGRTMRANDLLVNKPAALAENFF